MLRESSRLHVGDVSALTLNSTTPSSIAPIATPASINIATLPSRTTSVSPVSTKNNPSSRVGQFSVSFAQTEVF